MAPDRRAPRAGALCQIAGVRHTFVVARPPEPLHAVNSTVPTFSVPWEVGVVEFTTHSDGG